MSYNMYSDRISDTKKYHREKNIVDQKKKDNKKIT